MHLSSLPLRQRFLNLILRNLDPNIYSWNDYTCGASVLNPRGNLSIWRLLDYVPVGTGKSRPRPKSCKKNWALQLEQKGGLKRARDCCCPWSRSCRFRFYSGGRNGPRRWISEWTVEQERFEEIASNEESTPRDCRWLGFPTNKVRLFCLPSFLLWTINAYIGCTTHLTIWRVRQTRFPFRQIQYNSLSLSLMNLFLKWFAAPWYPKNKKYVWKVHWKYGNIIKTRFALQFEFVH